MQKHFRWIAAATIAGAWLAGVSFVGTAHAQMDHDHMTHGAPAGPVATGPAAEVQRSYAAVKGNILKAAEKMPAESFSFKPVPDVRTYARVVNHITEAQVRSCGVANGTKDMAKTPDETADRAAILDALKASFAECDKAFAALTDANVTEMFPLGQSKRSRIGLMWGTVSHDNEQYATLALYLRLKGITPPSSEK